jgi:hypothetical protein
MIQEINFCEGHKEAPISKTCQFKLTVKKGIIKFNCANDIEASYFDTSIKFEKLPNGENMIRLGLNFQLLDGNKSKPIPYSWVVKVSLIE